MSEQPADPNQGLVSPEEFEARSRELQRELARRLLRNRHHRVYRNLIKDNVARSDLTLAERAGDRLRAILGFRKRNGDGPEIAADLHTYTTLRSQSLLRADGALARYDPDEIVRPYLPPAPATVPGQPPAPDGQPTNQQYGAPPVAPDLTQGQAPAQQGQPVGQVPPPYVGPGQGPWGPPGVVPPQQFVPGPPFGPDPSQQAWPGQGPWGPPGVVPPQQFVPGPPFGPDPSQQAWPGQGPWGPPGAVPPQQFVPGPPFGPELQVPSTPPGPLASTRPSLAGIDWEHVPLDEVERRAIPKKVREHERVLLAEMMNSPSDRLRLFEVDDLALRLSPESRVVMWAIEELHDLGMTNRIGAAAILSRLIHLDVDLPTAKELGKLEGKKVTGPMEDAALRAIGADLERELAANRHAAVELSKRKIDAMWDTLGEENVPAEERERVLAEFLANDRAQETGQAQQAAPGGLDEGQQLSDQERVDQLTEELMREQNLESGQQSQGPPAGQETGQHPYPPALEKFDQEVKNLVAQGMPAMEAGDAVVNAMDPDQQAELVAAFAAVQGDLTQPIEPADPAVAAEPAEQAPVQARESGHEAVAAATTVMSPVVAPSSGARHAAKTADQEQVEKPAQQQQSGDTTPRHVKKL